MRVHPLRVRLKSPPGVMREEFLGEAELLRTRKLVGRVPGRVAPATSVGRRSVRMFAGIDLPDPVGPVSMSTRPAQDGGPKHKPLNVLPTGSKNPLVADFSYENGHTRVPQERSCDLVHRAGNALPAAVACLQHVEVEHRCVLDL